MAPFWIPLCSCKDWQSPWFCKHFFSPAHLPLAAISKCNQPLPDMDGHAAPLPAPLCWSSSFFPAEPSRESFVPQVSYYFFHLTYVSRGKIGWEQKKGEEAEIVSAPSYFLGALISSGGAKGGEMDTNPSYTQVWLSQHPMWVRQRMQAVMLRGAPGAWDAWLTRLVFIWGLEMGSREGWSTFFSLILQVYATKKSGQWGMSHPGFSFC